MRISLRGSLVSLIALAPVRAPVGAQPADRNRTFTVGTAVATRGQLAYGVIAVPAGSDSGSAIQVAVINGVKPGPVVAFVAGSHGTEYTSVVALTRLITRIDPKALAGTVIIAPLLNVASFEQMVPHINPVDRKGMNANYPGDPAGTQTSRALALVTEQIVKPADVIVDLHGGDLDEDLRPYSYWIRTGNAQQDEASRAMALAFGLDMIIVRDMNVADAASTRSLSGYALSLGKTTFVAEAGRAGARHSGRDRGTRTRFTRCARCSPDDHAYRSRRSEGNLGRSRRARARRRRRHVLRHRETRQYGEEGREDRLDHGLRWAPAR